MSILQSKKIIVAVSGSIAAYKSCLLTRLLRKNGAEVKVIMTDAAKDFVTPLTLATLSNNPVLSDFLEDKEQGTWSNHVDLGLWADAIVVAPATAHTMAKCAQGICNDLLTAVYLSARCPIFFAPAMDLDMYKHGSTLTNLALLESYGNYIIPSEYGELASGLIGEGRMPEPENIIKTLVGHFTKDTRALGKHIVITAGPTQEPIDPVRYISNHSTGKMGYSIATAFANAGANVTIVSGPVNIKVQHPNIKVIPVQSADQMYLQTKELFSSADAVIFSAAVADYTPEHVATTKIKKNDDKFAIDLKKNIDIAATLSPQKSENQITVGFALETNNELQNAILKLHKKQFDYVVLNSLNDPGAGFAHDTNKVTIIDKQETIRKFDLKPKSELAQDILNIILERWND